MYKGLEEDVTVFGVGATFVSSTNTDDEVVYQVVKAVFENFDRFRRLHPAFANLKKEDMITKNISAPLHDGAVRYYKEAGLMRSEEHTSELQSLMRTSYAVFCLKKKKTTIDITTKTSEQRKCK